MEATAASCARVLVRLSAHRVVRGAGTGWSKRPFDEHGDEDAPGRVVEPGGRYGAAGEEPRRDLDGAGAESGEGPCRAQAAATWSSPAQKSGTVWPWRPMPFFRSSNRPVCRVAKVPLIFG